MNVFPPEGTMSQEISTVNSRSSLAESAVNCTVLEGRATVCDKKHDLYVEYDGIRGVIPRSEGALGIDEGTTKDIAMISRVGKAVSFIVLDPSDNNAYGCPIFSRRAAQQRCRREYLDLLRQVKGIQYLIMGQHYLENEYENPLHCFKPTEEPARLVRYVDQVTEGLATGRFLYLAHPDVLNFQGDDAFYKEQMRRLCRNVKELGVPLELNLQGYRAGKNYPDRRFWEIAAEENCTAVIGCDAHRVRDVADPAELAYIRGFAEELGLKIAEKLALREDFLK